jgi:gamma-glutamylcyclotransferase (GGCT)/AIG2-like uncharacterized protein YtfP
MAQDGLFVYGTLLFPEVLGLLLGRAPERTPAAAHGWRVAALPGRVYPGLVPADGTARGLVLSRLTVPERRLIDAYEENLYDLRRITLTDGGSAWTYVWRDATDVSASDWDPDVFAARHLAAYVEGCTGWVSRYGGDRTA